MSAFRSWSRWLAAGLAVSLAVGFGTSTFLVSASPGATESTFVPVTPTRVLDTRTPTNLGLDGPFVSPTPQTLKVTGMIPTADGTQEVVPNGASGVTLNVTAVNASAAGFISIRPAGTPGPPSTSSLNFEAGQTTPNAVTVSLPTSGSNAGVIEITYDAYGLVGSDVDVLIDVLGYTTTAGIQLLVADLALKANTVDVYTKNQTDTALGTKANTADVYTKTESDAALGTKANTADVYTKSESDSAYVSHGPVVMTNGNIFFENQIGSRPSVFNQFNNALQFSGDGSVSMNLAGPASTGGLAYGLESVEYCIIDFDGGGSISSVAAVGGGLNPFFAFDFATRTDPGCYTLAVADSTAPSYVLNINGDGGPGARIRIYGVRTTWAPADTLDTASVTAQSHDETPSHILGISDD